MLRCQGKSRYRRVWFAYLSVTKPLQLQSEGVLRGKPYNNEYIFIHQFEEPKTLGDKPKIKILKEFVDSQYTNEIYNSLQSN